jgi:hypothetical protein
MAIERSLPAERISVHVGSAADFVTQLFERTDESAVVFAIGNIAGPGLALMDYFETHGESVRRTRQVRQATPTRRAA